MQYLLAHEAAALWGMSERRVTALCRDGRIPGAVKQGKNWQIPDHTAVPLDGRTRAYADRIRETQNRWNGEADREIQLSQPPSGEPAPAQKGNGVHYTEHDAGSHAAAKFCRIYRKEPEHVLFTPYRICPIGAHVDHNLGKITGFAIDKGIYMACATKTNGVVEIASLQFPKRAQWHVTSTPREKQNDWADHLRGATIALNARFPLSVGLSAIIDGELPIGGLSSSAAVIITFLSALCRLNHIRLTPRELITISKEAENNYVGVSCGKLDQSCEVFCRRNKLLVLDTLDDTYEQIPQNPDMKPYEFAVFFSGLERSLTLSKYNMRADECRSAAYMLKAFAGMEYGKFAETNLRDVPYEVFLQYGDRLPENFAKRARHWYSECRRAEEGAEAWRRGDLQEFGRLTFESGRSSITQWETGSAELIALYEIMKQTEGIYGGRFSGAGFKGCCMAIIDPAYEESILQTVEAEYLKRFPKLEGKFSAHICHSADGVIL